MDVYESKKKRAPPPRSRSPRPKTEARKQIIEMTEEIRQEESSLMLMFLFGIHLKSDVNGWCITQKPQQRISFINSEGRKSS